MRALRMLAPPAGRPGLHSWLTALVCLTAATCALAAPTVFFEPEPMCGGMPQTQFQGSLWVDGSGDSLGCFHLLMTFDRTRLQLVAATEGDLFGLAEPPTFFLWEYPAIDTTAFTDCLLGNRTFVLGPGELVKLTFKVLAGGCSADTAGLFQVPHRHDPPPFDISFLADIDRELIPDVTYRDGVSLLCEACTADARDLPSAAGASLDVTPNPAQERARIAWTLPLRSQQGRLEIFTASGRKVFDREISETRGEVDWDLGDANGTPVAAGAYFARLRCGDETLVRRIVRVR